MRHLHLVLTLLLFSCVGQTDSRKNEFIAEIPRHDNGDVDLFYKLTLDKSQQLNLDSIQTGYDSIQIRIWYEYSLTKTRKLLVLKNMAGVWEGRKYIMTVDWDWQAIRDSIESVESTTVVPVSGWDKFTEELFDLKITSLPNMDDIPGLEDGWFDGVTYNVEIATKYQYRFYGYHLPDKFQDEFWQARNMMSILNLVKRELKISWEFEGP
jgi:hypothetical protein